MAGEHDPRGNENDTGAAAALLCLVRRVEALSQPGGMYRQLLARELSMARAALVEAGVLRDPHATV